MKKILFFALPLLFSLSTTTSLHGQNLLKKLKEKIEKKSEEQAEQKIDKTIDKQFEEIDKSLSRKDTSNLKSTKNIETSQQRMPNILKGFGMTNTPITIADSYQFNYLIEMQIKSYNENGKELTQGNFVTLFNQNTKNFAYKMISEKTDNSEQGIFIIDTKNKATIILSENNGEKTGIIYGFDSIFNNNRNEQINQDNSENQETFLKNPKIKKTGRTKTIVGYRCEEYQYSDDESESKFWLTKDLKIHTQDLFSTLYKTDHYIRGFPWGYIMESTTINRITKEKSVMQVIRVDKNSNNNFTLSDYQITNIGSINLKE